MDFMKLKEHEDKARQAFDSLNRLEQLQLVLYGYRLLNLRIDDIPREIEREYKKELSK